MCIIKNYERVGVKDYYEKQIATLKSFEEVDAVVESDGIIEEDKEELAQQERAMKISNYANIVLLILKVYSILIHIFHHFHVFKSYFFSHKTKATFWIKFVLILDRGQKLYFFFCRVINF